MGFTDQLRDRAEQTVRDAYDIDESESLGSGFTRSVRQGTARDVEMATERLAPLLRSGDDGAYSSTPEPRAEDREDVSGRSSSIFWFTAEDDETVNVEAPGDDLDELWELFLSFSLLREPIRNFASEVTEPGYRINAEDDDMAELLDEWAEGCAIRAGEMGHDLTPFMNDMVVNKYVRGTTLVEHAPGAQDDDDLPEEVRDTLDANDIIAGLRLINPQTVKAHKRPNKNILLLPDDEVPEDGHETDEGETAAYVQYDDALDAYDDRDPIPFSQNDITKITLDADMGEAFGTGVVSTIRPRVEALIQKLEDRDMSIHAKGHPLTLFFCGDPNSERGVWSTEKTKDLAEQHSDENFTTKKKHFVPGDLDVEQIEGDVPDIDDAVMDDVEIIFASLPVPKYKIAYEESVNQFVVDAQEPAYERLVDDQRRELEAALTPIFQQKAEEFAAINDDLSDEGVELKVSPPESINPLERDQFDPGRYETLLSAISTWKESGAEMDFPPEFITWLMGVDMDEIDELDIPNPSDVDGTPSAPADEGEGEPEEPEEAPGSDVAPDEERPAVAAGAGADDAQSQAVAQFNATVDSLANGNGHADGGGEDTDTDVPSPDSLDGLDLGPEDVERLASQFTEGSVVATPNGRGVVMSVMTESFDFPQNGGEDSYAEVEASTTSPTYVVALSQGGSAPYSASAMKRSYFPDDNTGGQGGPETAAGEAEASIITGDDEGADLPSGWTRQSALSFWSSAGGTFDDVASALAESEDMTDDEAEQAAAAFRDRLLGTTRWRNRF